MYLVGLHIYITRWYTVPIVSSYILLYCFKQVDSRRIYRNKKSSNYILVNLRSIIPTNLYVTRFAISLTVCRVSRAQNVLGKVSSLAQIQPGISSVATCLQVSSIWCCKPFHLLVNLFPIRKWRSWKFSSRFITTFFVVLMLNYCATQKTQSDRKSPRKLPSPVFIVETTWTWCLV